jgi:anti-sigma factor ChrR (cupin superfamily)
MQTSVCPSPDELKDYVRGKLDSQQSDLVSEHMLLCSVCERTIVEIEANPDTLVELLRSEVGSAITGSVPSKDLLNLRPQNANGRIVLCNPATRLQSLSRA